MALNVLIMRDPERLSKMFNLSLVNDSQIPQPSLTDFVLFPNGDIIPKRHCHAECDVKAYQDIGHFF